MSCQLIGGLNDPTAVSGGCWYGQVAICFSSCPWSPAFGDICMQLYKGQTQLVMCKVGTTETQLYCQTVFKACPRHWFSVYFSTIMRWFKLNASIHLHFIIRSQSPNSGKVFFLRSFFEMQTEHFKRAANELHRRQHNELLSNSGKSVTFVHVGLQTLQISPKLIVLALLWTARISAKDNLYVCTAQ